MAGSLNRVQLIGHLGADPEVRSFQGGGKVAQLRLATSESWTDKQSGERKSKTEWHTVQIFNEGLIGVIEKYTRKGSKIFVEGQLRTRKWQDQSGNDRYSTEICIANFGGQVILLDRREGDESGGGDRSEGRGGYGSSTQRGQSGGGSQQRDSGGWGQTSGSGGSWGQTGGGGFGDDLDDDIPF